MPSSRSSSSRQTDAAESERGPAAAPSSVELTEPQSGPPARIQARVRDSRDEDLPAIHAIYAHHVREGTGSFELEPPTLDEMRARRAEVLARGFPYLVAEFDGAVAGYAYVNYFRTRPAYRFLVENSIYLDDRMRGRGIGKKLMVVLIDRCTALGLRQMLAVIGDSANVGSIGLHASCGFRFAGVVQASGWKHGRWLDTVMMQRSLGHGGERAPDEGPAGQTAQRPL